MEPYRLCHLNDTSFCTQRFGKESSCSEYTKGGVGYAPFENILSAMLTVLQVITMEDWVLVSYDVRNRFFFLFFL